ncbi:MAG: phosphoribosylglycinamide formyltransferase [Firmicutes bacterium]|nr:phosphoribosylglycinamide formyltransferase [Bacillota bacterium]
MFKLAVLASGQGSNLQALIDQVHAPGEAEVVAVLSDNPKAPALERARKAGIPAQAVAPTAGEGREAFHQRLAAVLDPYQPQLLVLAGYMRILPESFLEHFPAIINVHPSLLPAFPGLDAPRQAIEYGVKVSGCTVHQVDAGMDTGPILLQAAVPVFTDDTPETLHQRIKPWEHKLLAEAVLMWRDQRWK